MNKTVLAALLAVAGTAVSAQAQTTFTIEARLIVDGNAEAPTGPGIQTFLPGAGATRVGLTVQARVIQNVSSSTAGSGNWGIGGVNNVSVANLARFTHNDPFSGGAYQPFARGGVSTQNDAGANNYGGGAGANVDGLPLAGAFGPDATAFAQLPDPDGAGPLTGSTVRDFRVGAISSINGGAPSVNSLRGNYPGGPGNNPPAATGTNATSANGFFAPSATQMSFVSAVVASTGTGLGTTPLFAVGTMTPWYNIYRVYFDPQPNASDPVRDVTVSFFGRFIAVTRFVATPVAQYTLGNGTGITGGQLETTVSATFAVPTPGAAALLGLGGLVASRRRRA